MSYSYLKPMTRAVVAAALLVGLVGCEPKTEKQLHEELIPLGAASRVRIFPLPDGRKVVCIVWRGTDCDWDNAK